MYLVICSHYLKHSKQLSAVIIKDLVPFLDKFYSRIEIGNIIIFNAYFMIFCFDFFL